jgi:hypothetical protein
MAKIFASLLAGISLAFALPALGAQEVGKPRDEGEHVKNIVIQGELGPLLAHRARGRYSAEALVNGATYELQFVEAPHLIDQARQLRGRTVVVTGLERPGSRSIFVTSLTLAAVTAKPAPSAQGAP